MCLNCLDLTKERSEKSRSIDSKNQRKLYLKRKRDLCVAFGICRECLKRKATVGMKCLECHVKQIKRNEKKRSKVKRSQRVELGLCYFCGEPVIEGQKTCKKCYEIQSEKLKKWTKTRDNSNHYWRKIQTCEVKQVLINRDKYINSEVAI